MPWSNYKRIREIGSGSFGHAYLVQARESVGKVPADRRLVMKEISLAGKDPKQRAACEIEVKVLNALKHPYIVRYHESFLHDQHLCIVMDYCEGGDLWQYVQQWRRQARGPLQPIPEPQVLRWLCQLAIALKFMHEKNVLHRDIKTQNIFLAKPEGGGALRCVKIADFGIAKVLKDSASLAHTQVGTPYYLSPEICQKQPYACPSDIWSLGCVIFELCALRVPFEAQDMPQLVNRIVAGPMPRLPAGYSREISELVGELLCRDPQRRATAAVILQRPLVQQEIKRMLSEKQAVGSEGAAAQEQGGGQAAAPSQPRTSARGPSPRPPIGVPSAAALRGASPSPSPSPPSARAQHAASPSPSPSPGHGAGTPRHRDASPHSRCAMEVLRPSRAPSKEALPRAHPHGHQRVGGA